MISPQSRSVAATGAAACVICVLAALLSSGCVPRRQPEDPPRPTRTVTLDTIEASNVGTRIVITAGVSAVITPQSFVVRDADLPEDGLLVLGDAPADLARPDLVTVYGVIDLFQYSRFVSTHDLASAPLYERYENRKVLVAADVTSQA